MKRKYVKPMLVYESYQLSQSIAACFYKVDAVSANNCMTVGNENPIMGYIEPGGFLNLNNCRYIINEYCYTNGSGDFATHMS